MSYREENDQVILTMSREDYEGMLMVFAAATVQIRQMTGKTDRVMALLNRLNSGNPHYTPYQVEAKK
jgi:hypothetical protein